MSAPTDLTVGPLRVARLAELLSNREASARVVREKVGGAVTGGKPGVIAIGGRPIALPEDAQISIQSDSDGRPGIEINSDFFPEPPGTWVRIRATAIGEAKAVLAELGNLPDEDYKEDTGSSTFG